MLIYRLARIIASYPVRFCYDESVWQRVAVKQGRSFLKHVIPAVLKPLRALWNQLIGSLFLCLGVMCGVTAIRALQAGSGFRVFVGSLCALVMAWYGISSFWRARKISRS
jgi:hypothetical protein